MNANQTHTIDGMKITFKETLPFIRANVSTVKEILSIYFKRIFPNY
jgi:hypothetical protein